MTRGELLRTLAALYGDDPWPKPLHLLRGLQLVGEGTGIREAARSVGTSQSRLRQASSARDPLLDVLGSTLRSIRQGSDRAQMLGQLLLGRCAELAFEDIYRSEVGTQEFELRDLREGRTDTDYRLYNGQGRPVYRVNIKFHGSQFRRAQELVGLDPDDCFALATYKIHSALQKQEEEGLPYIFAIVGVPNLTGSNIGSELPSNLTDAVTFLSQAARRPPIRDLEDTVVEHVIAENAAVFSKTLAKIEAADWYVLSARRAAALMEENLFERVFALRMRNFSRAFSSAELDMHFSLSSDLTPLKEFLQTLRAGGPQTVTTLLERGDY